MSRFNSEGLCYLNDCVHNESFCIPVRAFLKGVCKPGKVSNVIQDAIMNMK